MDKPNNHEIAGIVNYNTDNGEQFDMISWKTFCEKFDIGEVSILKINIEGSEYSFLDSLDESDFSKINQIVISFHNWMNAEYKEPTEKAIHLLQKHGYTVISTYFPYGWYVCVKNEIVNKSIFK